jgi:hypothetical protein
MAAYSESLIRAPPLPRNFRVALRSRQSLGPSGSTGVPSLATFGLLEFLSSVPGYTNDLYDIYKWCKILSTEVTYNIVSTTSNPVQVVCAVLPNNTTLGMTIDRAAEIPGSVVKMLSPQGGLDKVEITRKYNTQTMVGSRVAEKYWINKVQAASSTPLEAEEPVMFLMAQPLISVNWSTQLIVDITYHCEFFDLNPPI